MTKFRPGDLVKIIKNDMSIVINKSGQKDNRCFNKIGVVLRYYRYGASRSKQWFVVNLPAGIYDVREDAIASL